MKRVLFLATAAAAVFVALSHLPRPAGKPHADVASPAAATSLTPVQAIAPTAAAPRTVAAVPTKVLFPTAQVFVDGADFGFERWRAAPPPRLRVDVPELGPRDMMLQRVTQKADHIIWVGKGRARHESLVVVVTPDRAFGVLSTAEGQFDLHAAGRQTSVVRRDAVVSCEEMDSVGVLSAPFARAASGGEQRVTPPTPRIAAANEVHVADVLFFYEQTTEAANAAEAGGIDQVPAFLTTKYRAYLESCNVALRDSGVANLEWALAAVVRAPDVTDPGTNGPVMGEFMGLVPGSAMGDFANAKAWEHHADTSILLVAYNRGPSLGSELGHAALVEEATGYLTLAHEIGHTYGLLHQRTQHNAPDGNGVYLYGFSFPYSYTFAGSDGPVQITHDISDIMAYGVTQPYFSSPDVYVAERDLGMDPSAGDTLHRLGLPADHPKAADCARALRERAATYAAYRVMGDVSPKIAKQPEGRTVRIGESALLSVEVLVDAGDVTYQWRRNGTALEGQTSQYLGFEPNPWHAGWYDVVVTAGGRTVTSTPVYMGIGSASPTEVQQLDPDYFVPLESRSINRPLTRAVPTPNGGAYVVGRFVRVDGHATAQVVRLNPDLSVDASFQAAPVDGDILHLARQPDGKIVIGGLFDRVGGLRQPTLARLNVDGSEDRTFRPRLTGRNVAGIAIDSTGRIVVAASFGIGQAERWVSRFLSSGEMDPTFVAPVFSDRVSALAIVEDDGLLVTGSFTSVGGLSRNGIVRLASSGAVDTAFETGVGFNAPPTAVLATPEGYIVGGDFSAYRGVIKGQLVRLTTTGELDAAFNPTSAQRPTIAGLALDGAGRVVVAGTWYHTAGNPIGLARLGHDGAAEIGFAPGLGATPNSVAVLGDGRIAITSDQAFSASSGGFLVLDPTGTAVSPARHWYFPARATAMTHAPYGVVYVAGDFDHAGGEPCRGLVRLLPDGTPDRTYGAAIGGNVTRLIAQSDRKLVVVGTDLVVNGVPQTGVIRLTAGGALDTSFSTGQGPNGTVTDAVALPNDRIALCGTFSQWSGTFARFLVILDADGTVISGAPNFHDGWIHGVAPQPDGRLIVVGSFTSYAGTPRDRIARLNPDLALDNTFVPPSGIGLSEARKVAIRPDGKIVISAEVELQLGEGLLGAAIIVLEPDGSLVRINKEKSFARPVVIIPQPDSSVLLPLGNLIQIGSSAVKDGLLKVSPDGAYDPSSCLPLAMEGAVVLPAGDGGMWLAGPVALDQSDGRGGLRHGIVRTINRPGPVIIDPLPDQAFIEPGGSTTVFATAVGGTSPAFSWEKDGQPLPGRDTATLWLDDGPEVAGTYVLTVREGDRADTTSTTVAVRSRQVAPVVSPVAMTHDLAAGSAMTLRPVISDGGRPLTYEWSRDGVVLPDEKGPTLAKAAWRPDDSGRYSLRVSNAHGSATSGDIDLRVAKAHLTQLHQPGLPVSAPLQVMNAGSEFFVSNHRGALFHSTDGATWGAARLDGRSNPVRGVVQGPGGKILALTEQGGVHVRGDDQVWESRHTGFGLGDETLNAIAANSTRVVAVGKKNGHGFIATSVDGAAWTVATRSPAFTEFFEVLWDGARFVALGYHRSGYTRFFVSGDGLTWSDCGPLGFWARNLASGNGRYMVIDTAGMCVRASTDLRDWTNRVYFSPSLRALAHVGDRFVLMTYASKVLASADGQSWSPWVVEPIQSSFAQLGGLAYAGGRYLLGSSHVPGPLLLSTDGEAWTLANGGVRREPFVAIVADGTILVAVDNGGRVLRSSDGVSWNRSDLSGQARAAAFGNGVFLILGDGRVYRSADGVAWAEHPLEAGTGAALAWGAGLFVAADTLGKVSVSSDGVTWVSPFTLPNTLGRATVAYGNGKFVAVSGSGGVATSTDGLAWMTESTSLNISGTPRLASGNGRLVVTHGSDSVWVSTDGATWSTRSVGSVTDGVSYAAGRFYASGSRDFWSSPDGLVWERGFSGADGNLGGFAAFRGSIYAGDSVGMIVSGEGAGKARLLQGLTSTSRYEAGEALTLGIVAEGDDLQYQWSKDGVPIPGGGGSTLTLPRLSGSDTGLYRVSVVGRDGTVTSETTVRVMAAAGARTLAGVTFLTPGRWGAPFDLAAFRHESASSKDFLVRALGPSAAALGYDVAAMDLPKLGLTSADGQRYTFNVSSALAPNRAAILERTAALGLLPFTGDGSADAAFLIALPPGTHLASLLQPSGGLNLGEIYDADRRGRMVYVAARTVIQSGAASTVGLVVEGDGEREFLIRVLGPTADAVGGLPDPAVRLYRGETLLAENDDWVASAALEAAQAQAGAQGLEPGSKDAAFLCTLGTGGYTLSIAGGPGESGDVLVEIFEVDAGLADAYPPAVVFSPQPRSVTALTHATSFRAVTIGKPAPSLQWRRNGVAIPGATSHTLTFASTAETDLAVYDVVATNWSGTATSSPAALSVRPSELYNYGLRNYVEWHLDHFVGRFYTPGATQRFYLEGSSGLDATGVTYTLLAPPGSSLISHNGMGALSAPRPGDGGALVWEFHSSVEDSLQADLAIPASTTGVLGVYGRVDFRRSDGQPGVVLPVGVRLLPRPLHHDADQNADGAISLSELTRVIELYNTRAGVTRTGAYQNQPGSSDGFSGDLARPALSAVSLLVHHAADSNRDGSIGLLELTRVIDLYNTRAGPVRTGRYHRQLGTEDGFAPGP